MENFNPLRDKALSKCTDNEIKQELINRFNELSGIMPISTASSSWFENIVNEIEKRGLSKDEDIEHIVKKYQDRIESNSNELIYIDFKPHKPLIIKKKFTKKRFTKIKKHITNAFNPYKGLSDLEYAEICSKL